MYFCWWRHVRSVEERLLKFRTADRTSGTMHPRGGSVRYRLLGPLQIWRGGAELRLGGPRQRALLAALALHANETVSFEHLVEAVWESPPAAPESNIRTYVAALRKLVRSEERRVGKECRRRW